MTAAAYIARLLDFLQRPESYPHQPSSVQVVQTHASIVALVPPYVFKIKKPVNFGFLDFSTLEKRHFFCLQEVRLNRRLCRGLYIGVLPLCQQGDRWVWGNAGTPIEYAVVMHYLPPHGFAHTLLQQRQLHRWHLEQVAVILARFYQQQTPTAEIAAWGHPEKIRISTDENITQTRSFVDTVVSANSFHILTEYTQWWYDHRAAMFAQRVAQGWIRDCHGDLRLEHIHIQGDRVCIYDCIEFNPRLRWIDVAADGAFLVMDLLYFQAPEYARFFARQLSQELADPSFLALLPFYLVYRAWVRAKVECFKTRAAELPEQERQEARIRARRFFRIALRTALFGLQPVVIVVMGKIGSGKTTVAAALSAELGWHHFSTDAMRKEMRGLPLYELPAAEVRSVIYHRQVSRTVYRTLFYRARRAVQYENGVILEGTFSRRRFRQEARSYFRRFGVSVVFLYLVASDEHIRQRLQQRAEQHTISDARQTEFEALAPFYEEPQPDETDVLVVSTEQPLEETLRHCLQQLLERNLALQQGVR